MIYNDRIYGKVKIKEPAILELIKRLSGVEKNWAKIVKEESKPKEYFIKFER